MDYVKDLMYFGMKGRKIEETDIGIISPYKKQYTRIQEELCRRQWNKIEVGAVETFQGKEKPIIIVSTVRSFTKNLGFLENPRRLNVILSRAKALLIMIGNPKTLSQNKDFKYIIDECARNKCIRGGGELSVLVENTTNNINLNSNEHHSKPKPLVNQTRPRKCDSKAKKSLVLENVNKKPILRENNNGNNFEAVNQIRSKISSAFKTVESNPKYVNDYLTSEKMGSYGAKMESRAPLSGWYTDQNHQYKPRQIPTFNPETMKKKNVFKSQNGIASPIIKPYGTVLPRRNVQEAFITLPSRVSPITIRERHEIDTSLQRQYSHYVDPNNVKKELKKKSKKWDCVIS